MQRLALHSPGKETETMSIRHFFTQFRILITELFQNLEENAVCEDLCHGCFIKQQQMQLLPHQVFVGSIKQISSSVSKAGLNHIDITKVKASFQLVNLTIKQLPEDQCVYLLQLHLLSSFQY